MSHRYWNFLEVLCRCVRLLTLGQAMRLLGVRDAANFRRWLKPPEERGLVRQLVVMAKPVPVMKEPLFAWERGRPAASIDITAILSFARARWAGLPASPVRVCVATNHARDIFGVRRLRIGQLRKPLQCSHDLTVSAVALRYAEQLGQMESWIGEDFSDMCVLDGCVLDAVILDSKGLPQKGIEVIGSDYDEPRIRRTCQQCYINGIRYVELW